MFGLVAKMLHGLPASCAEFPDLLRLCFLPPANVHHGKQEADGPVLNKTHKMWAKTK